MPVGEHKSVHDFLRTMFAHQYSQQTILPMKKIALFGFLILLGSAGFSQTLKEKMAAKMAGGGGGSGSAAKAVEPPDGEYSDPSGLSGTYFATSDLPYGDGKKVAKIIKLEFVEGENKVIMHAMKGETDASELYMLDYRKYARDKFKISQFSAGDFHIFTVEPGVVVFGAYKWAPKEYPGYTEGMMIADTAKITPVILVKDESMMTKYTYADAKRIIGECGTFSEITNTLRVAENTPLPTIGKMTTDKELINRSVELMKAEWADSKEPGFFKGCYIYNDDWGYVVYGKGYVGSTTLSDEVTAIMLFMDPRTKLCYYYAVGISREREELEKSGQYVNQRGMVFTGSSTIQYITEEKLQNCLKEIGQ
jgi:hypothetical protein